MQIQFPISGSDEPVTKMEEASSDEDGTNEKMKWFLKQGKMNQFWVTWKEKTINKCRMLIFQSKSNNKLGNVLVKLQQLTMQNNSCVLSHIEHQNK